MRNIGGRVVYVCAQDGPSLAADDVLSGLIGEVLSASARMVAIPLTRLCADFLRLGTGVAGQVLQKLVNYRIQVAVVGDVSEVAIRSAPLRDFIRESNRGESVWFVDDLDALAAKLASG